MESGPLSYFPHGKAYSWRVRQVCRCRGHLTAEGALTQRLRSWTSLGWRRAWGERASSGEVEGTESEWGKVSVRISPPSHEGLSARLKKKTSAPGLRRMTRNEGIRARNVNTWESVTTRRVPVLDGSSLQRLRCKGCAGRLVWEEHRDPQGLSDKASVMANGQQEKLHNGVEPGASLLTWSLTYGIMVICKAKGKKTHLIRLYFHWAYFNVHELSYFWNILALFILAESLFLILQINMLLPLQKFSHFLIIYTYKYVLKADGNFLTHWQKTHF